MVGGLVQFLQHPRKFTLNIKTRGKRRRRRRRRRRPQQQQQQQQQQKKKKKRVSSPFPLFQTCQEPIPYPKPVDWNSAPKNTCKAQKLNLKN